MNGLHLKRVAVTLTVKLQNESLQRHLSASPYVVGETLAEQIAQYVRTTALGYYPALEYFRQQGGIDADLLDAVDNIAWLASNMVREEITIRLRPVFSKIRFESLQTIAFTLPQIRPGSSNALHRLTTHYIPDTIRVGLEATLIQKMEDGQRAEKFTEHLIHTWLDKRFESVTVHNVQVSE